MTLLRVPRYCCLEYADVGFRSLLSASHKDAYQMQPYLATPDVLWGCNEALREALASADSHALRVICHMGKKIQVIHIQSIDFDYQRYIEQQVSKYNLQIQLTLIRLDSLSMSKVLKGIL